MLGKIELINFIGMKLKMFAYTKVITNEVLMNVDMNKWSKRDRDCFEIESYLP